MAEEVRTVEYYRSLSTEVLEEEINREQKELASLKTDINNRRTLLEEARERRDRAYSRWHHWMKQRRQAEEKVEQLKKTTKIWSTQLDEEVPSDVFSLLDKRFRDVIYLTEYYRRMREEGYTRTPADILYGEYTRGELRFPTAPPEELEETRRRLRETLSREREERKGYEKTKEKIKDITEETEREKREQKEIELELNKKHKAVHRYNLVQYTKYWEVIRTNPDRTPPVKFEIRGNFTVPTHLDPGDSRVLTVISKNFDKAFQDWGTEATRTVVEEARPKRRPERPGLRYEERPGERGLLMVESSKTIQMENWMEGPTALGAEEIEKVDEYRSTITATLTKNEERAWELEIYKPESEFPEE